MSKFQFLQVVFCLVLAGISYFRPTGSEEIFPDEKEFPVILDGHQRPTTSRNVREMLHANYGPLYIGAFKDSISANFHLLLPPTLLPRQPSYERHTPTNHYYYWGEGKQFSTWWSAKLEINIDTTARIKKLDKTTDGRLAYFNAYPVLITNLTADTVRVGFERKIPLIMEARDLRGQWRPIELPAIYHCRTGIPYIGLPPDQMILTSASVFGGEFLTDLRLKIGENYSPAFKGSINYGQFGNH